MVSGETETGREVNCIITKRFVRRASKLASDFGVQLSATKLQQAYSRKWFTAGASYTT